MRLWKLNTVDATPRSQWLWILALAVLAMTVPAQDTASITDTVSSGGPEIRVALYKGPGTGGKGPPALMQRLESAPTSTIAEISPEQIRTGTLTNYDVVIFAGGSGSGQANAIGAEGREAVRQFVGNGGGYIGICAGAYLATSGFSWGLNLINAKTISPKWRRGVGSVKLELTDPGRAILGERTGEFDVRYVNGPIIEPANKTDLPPFATLAFFRTELAMNDTPAGIMVNSPAIFAGQYLQGRVVCISPHPEQTSSLEDFVPRAVSWAAQRDPTQVSNSPLRLE
jgi:putative intracellular protease/amidase